MVDYIYTSKFSFLVILFPILFCVTLYRNMDVNFIMLFKIEFKRTHNYKFILHLGQKNELILHL